MIRTQSCIIVPTPWVWCVAEFQMLVVLQEILLYLLDIAFRLAQQVQPVVVSNVSACKSATLATMHFNADPPHPYQAYPGMVLTAMAVLLHWIGKNPSILMYLVACSVLGYRMQGRFRCISLYMQYQQGFQICVEDCFSQAFHPLAHRPCFADTMMAFVQDLFLGVDGLSPVQWHPYSTVGGDGEHTLVAHIKGLWQVGTCPRTLFMCQAVEQRCAVQTILHKPHTNPLKNLSGLILRLGDWSKVWGVRGSLEGISLRHTGSQKGRREGF